MAPKKTLYVPLGDWVVLHPHQFALGETLEFIRLPYDLMAYVGGRSSWGREGLVVATAIGVHPTFSGTITLELRNLGEVPLRLYPGDLIAQLFVHTVEAPITGDSALRSLFAGATGATHGQHRYDATKKVLQALYARFHGPREGSKSQKTT